MTKENIKTIPQLENMGCGFSLLGFLFTKFGVPEAKSFWMN